MPSNYFHTRERLGALGGIVQHHTALYRSVAVHEPTVVIVRRGCKKLRWAGRELRIAAGEAVALAGGQTFDVINIPDSDDLYQAQWIAFEQEAIERFAAQYGTAQAVCDAVKLPHPGRMNAAFDYAAAVLADEEVPHNAAEAALCGVLAWLQHDGIGFAVYEGFNLMRQIRKLITADMAADWSSAMLAQRLNCSEAALRRRLARQDTNFRTLLTDVRMMRALTLLQVTQWPVAQIAGAVGYDCPSRFSARFKERSARKRSRRHIGARGRSASVFDREFCFAQAVCPSKETDQRWCGFGGDVRQLGDFQRGKREFVAVFPAFRRTRAAVARSAEVCAGLQRAFGQPAALCGNACGQAADIGWDVGDHPVHPAQAGRCVFIVNGQDETFCPCGRIFPRQRGRSIAARTAKAVRRAQKLVLRKAAVFGRVVELQRECALGKGSG